MSPKFVLSAKYPFVHRYETDLPSRLEALRRENEALRAKLVAVQQTKVAALTQAEQLRKEKERLRARASILKQKLTSEGVMNSQLSSRIAELQELVESLADPKLEK